MENVEQTIISQYANSPTIVALIKNMNQYIQPHTDFEAFYNFVWNVDTAQGFGLDIWGRIVNISRTLQIPQDPIYFGYKEALPGSFPFNDQPFYLGIPSATQAYVLSDDAYRQLILVKALANISATTAPSLNQILQNLFAGQGRCYVVDLGHMQMRYVFEFLLSPYQFAIMTTSSALPHGAGVSISLMNTPLPCFGFAEAGTDSAAPFDQAPFLATGAIEYAIS